MTQAAADAVPTGFLQWAETKIHVMFGMGMGRSNPRMRFFRLGLLVLIVLSGVVFHHTGKVYETIRIFYYIAIVGFLMTAFSQRKQMGQGAQRFGRTIPRQRPMDGPQYSKSFSQQQPVQEPIETRLVEKEKPADPVI